MILLSCCNYILLSFKIKTDAQANRDPVVCTVDEARDTPFIKQVVENETLHFPSKSTMDRLSREELAAFYHRYDIPVHL